jgi:hypothetical protein
LNRIEKIDAENRSFYSEMIKNFEGGKTHLGEILGFQPKYPAVFIPRVRCANIAPNSSICRKAENTPGGNIFALAPMYDSIIYPIVPWNDEQEKLTISEFKKYTDVSLKDFMTFVERGRIIPYFAAEYEQYDEQLISNFLEPGIPRISLYHMELVRRKTMCAFVNSDCNRCKEMTKIAEEDLKREVDDGEKLAKRGCSLCLARAYSLGIAKQDLLKTSSFGDTLCGIVDIVASRNMGATYKTNCWYKKEALSLVAGSQGVSEPFETIVKGLKVSYSSELDLENYLDIIDSKTTRAIREITKKITEDPFALKYSERLNSKLFEFNREIEEVGKSRMAKFYQAISDIAVYGGTKFAEHQSQSYLKVASRDAHKASEWLASKFMDLHAKATGKDWTIAQISRTRWKIDECKKEELL